MTSMVIYRAEDGKLAGFGERGRRAWLKFVKKVAELEIGETLSFSYVLPRSPVHHSFVFLQMTGLFERQEQFSDIERFLDFLKIGAGFVDYYPGQNGVFVALPKSIAWHKCCEQDFIEFHKSVSDFLWAPYAQAVLWPHLNDAQRYDCIDNWHREFDRT